MWPNDLAVKLHSITGALSAEHQALVTLLALAVWIGVFIVLPALGLGALWRPKEDDLAIYREAPRSRR